MLVTSTEREVGNNQVIDFVCIKGQKVVLYKPILFTSQNVLQIWIDLNNVYSLISAMTVPCLLNVVADVALARAWLKNVFNVFKVYAFKHPLNKRRWSWIEIFNHLRNLSFLKSFNSCQTVLNSFITRLAVCLNHVERCAHVCRSIPEGILLDGDLIAAALDCLSLVVRR